MRSERAPLPDLPRNRETKLDVVGSVLLAAASALLIYPLVQGREHDWPPWCFLMMGASAIIFAGFVVSERRSAHPLEEAARIRSGQPHTTVEEQAVMAQAVELARDAHA